MRIRSGPKIVGLDIGTSGIRAVELTRDRRSGDHIIARAASVELPRGSVSNGVIIEADVVAKALRRLWREGRFSTRKVAFGLADGSVLTRQLELPWMPADDFRTALRYQINDALPVELETVEIDYHLLEEVRRVDDHGQPVDVNRILVVAANSAAVTAEASVLRRARLVPVRADSAAFALIRAACRGVLPTNDDVLAIADIGADQLTVVIYRAGQPRFIRAIANLGGETATVAVAERLRVSPEAAEQLKRETGLNGPAPVIAPIAESTVFGGVAGGGPAIDPRVTATVDTLNPWATTVINEIRNSLDYFHASEPTVSVQSLTITGRTADLTGLVDRIGTQIPLPIRVMDPMAGLTAARRVAKRLDRDTRLAVAAGLAMGGGA